MQFRRVSAEEEIGVNALCSREGRYCCEQHENLARALMSQVQRSAVDRAEMQLLTLLTKAAYHSGPVEFISQEMLRALVNGMEMFSIIGKVAIERALEECTRGTISDIGVFAKLIAQSYGDALNSL
jgi:hypothetical protein